MSAQTVVVRKVLRASPEEVFNAWLDAEGMSAWMFPGPVIACRATIDARVGGAFHIVMDAPGIQFVHRGEYRVLDRPSKIEFTWLSSRMGFEETLVTIELHPAGDDCELVLTHRRVPPKYSAPELARGWTQIVEKLGAHLAR